MFRTTALIFACLVAPLASASTAAVPTKTQLQSVLDAWGFQHRNDKDGVWKATTAPKALKPANVAKDVVLSHPKPNAMGGATITAHVLKGTPPQAVFEKHIAGAAPKSAHRWFGPVRTDVLPK